MPTVIFDPRLLQEQLVEDGKTYSAGQELTVSKQRLDELLAAGISLVEKSDLQELKLTELRDRAAALGVEDVEKLRTKDAAIAAIENASASSTTPPEAAGEGHDNNQEA